MRTHLLLILALLAAATPAFACRYTGTNAEAEQSTAFVIPDEGEAIFTRHGFITYPGETYAEIKP